MLVTIVVTCTCTCTFTFTSFFQCEKVEIIEKLGKSLKKKSEYNLYKRPMRLIDVPPVDCHYTQYLCTSLSLIGFYTKVSWISSARVPIIKLSIGKW